MKNKALSILLSASIAATLFVGLADTNKIIESTNLSSTSSISLCNFPPHLDPETDD